MGGRYLERVSISDFHYGGVKVVKSTMKIDRMAIVAYTGDTKKTISKTMSKRMFRKHTVGQHTCFLSNVTSSVSSTITRSGEMR